MSDNKIQFNLNCNERPEWLDSDNKQLLGDVNVTLNCDSAKRRHEWHNAPEDMPYLKAFFDNKSIKEIEAMFRQEPKTLDSKI